MCEVVRPGRSHLPAFADYEARVIEIWTENNAYGVRTVLALTIATPVFARG